MRNSTAAQLAAVGVLMLVIGLVAGSLLLGKTTTTTQIVTSKDMEVLTSTKSTLVTASPIITNTAEPENYTVVKASFYDHLLAFESRNASLAAGDYEKNASLNWGYFAGAGLNGLYNGPLNIEALYGSIFSITPSLALSNVSIFSIELQNNNAFINSSFSLVGNTTLNKPPCSNALNGTAIEEIYFSYSSNGNRWLISNDTWVFNPSELNTGGPTVWQVCAN